MNWQNPLQKIVCRLMANGYETQVKMLKATMGIFSRDKEKIEQQKQKEGPSLGGM